MPRKDPQDPPEQGGMLRGKPRNSELRSSELRSGELGMGELRDSETRGSEMRGWLSSLDCDPRGSELRSSSSRASDPRSSQLRGSGPRGSTLRSSFTMANPTLSSCTAARALGNSSTKSSTVPDVPRNTRIDPLKTSEGINVHDNGFATQTIGLSTRAEAADGNPHRASPEAVDRDKMRRERSTSASARDEVADGNPQRRSPEAVDRDGMKTERSMSDLFLLIKKDRPPTTLFRCSTAAVKEGLRNSDFMSSQLLEEYAAWEGGGQGEEEDNTLRDEAVDRGLAETKRQDNRRCEPRPAQLKSAPCQVKLGTNVAAPSRDAASCKRIEGGTERAPLYLKGAEVRYRSASLPLQAATVVGVHQDNLLEPYYTIRMREGGREKQTDNAHLVPGP